MNILITGATGFVGQHLLEELAEDNLDIKIISRQQHPKFWCANKNFKIIQADISNKESLKEAFSNIDVVINLAAELKRTENFEHTNILGTENIVKLSRENRVKKIIHLSSVGVVGMQYSLKPVVINENSICNPKNEYERTKLKAEQLIKNSNIPFAILRPTNIYGDHHPRKALLGFFQRLKNEKPFVIKKDALVNYVYVKDVAHAIRFCLHNNIENKTINIGEATHLKNFLELASKQLDTLVNTIYAPSLIFGLMNSLHYFGIKKLKTNLRGISNCVEYDDTYMKKNVQYKYGLKTGLINTIAYYKIA